MSQYQITINTLKESPKVWLITGVAGFIGSNLLETLLLANQKVVGLDNFSTGKKTNLSDVAANVSTAQWNAFRFIKGDITNLEDCRSALTWLNEPDQSPIAVDYVLHQAALGSVPRSLADPITTNQSNIDGFLNMLVASRDANVGSFTYAASSSTYGDHPALPKEEENIGNPLSPYAVTKYVNELYADVFSRSYGFNCIGLRYFNVFGKRQDPNGAYAAVIPKWVSAMINDDVVYINGDGETSRDFCFIENTVQANILAATASTLTNSQVYNVAVGDRSTLKQLFDLIRTALNNNGVMYNQNPVYRDFRAGDVRHSQASINKIKEALGYQPSHGLQQGIDIAMPWYVEYLSDINE